MKNSADVIASLPSTTTPAGMVRQPSPSTRPPPVVCAVDSAAAKSLALPSTSGDTVVGIGMPNLATCAAKNRPTHPTFSTSTASMSILLPSSLVPVEEELE